MHMVTQVYLNKLLRSTSYWVWLAYIFRSNDIIGQSQKTFTILKCNWLIYLLLTLRISFAISVSLNNRLFH